MITKIWLQEYGPFRKAELGLAPLTVLVGPNGSGKTMAMESLRRVQKALDAAPLVFDDERNLLNDEAVDETAGVFFSSFGRSSGTDRGYIAFSVDSSRFFFSKLSASEPPIANSQVALPESFPLITLLKFEPESLREASYLEAYELSIQDDGYGLATVLADMKLQDDERLEWIENQVKAIIPNFSRVRIRRAQVERNSELVAGNELIFDMKTAPGLTPNLVSDGTILVLGIVTSIDAATRLGRDAVLVLIDDLERGLHPQALKDFIGCLRRMTEEIDVQILATSHSPYLLDWLKPEEVRLTGFLEDGSATICELSDHPEFERWKDVMTPGEFWSTAGEDWIRDVRQ